MTLKPMCVVKVAGDGDCLFHALAFFDGSDGAALRIEVADFMEEHAHEQAGFHEEWLQEAAKLRCNKWGGHSVVAAYSLMKQRRVTIHTIQGVGQPVLVAEASHAALFGNEALPMAHVLYNNKDHYDALVEISDLTGAQPAWPQLPPPMYFKDKRAEEFPPLTSDAAGKKDKKKGLTAPRPAKKAKAKAAKPASAKSKKDNEGEAAAAVAKPTAAMGAPLQVESAEEENNAAPGLMELLEAIPVAETSDHPHRKVEDMIQDSVLHSIEVFRYSNWFWTSVS